MLLGTDNFRQGIVTRRRGNLSDGFVLSRCSGYDCVSGELIPDKIASVLTNRPLTGGAKASQVALSFPGSLQNTVLAFDVNSKIQEYVAASGWNNDASAPAVANLLVGRPTKCGQLAVYPTVGPNPKLIAYEPGADAHIARPLGAMSPSDYNEFIQPTVVLSPKEREITTVTLDAGNPTRFYAGDSSYPLGGRLRFRSTGALPTGLTADTDYYAIYLPAPITAEWIGVATTPGGTGIECSDDGSGTLYMQIFPYYKLDEYDASHLWTSGGAAYTVTSSDANKTVLSLSTSSAASTKAFSKVTWPTVASAAQWNSSYWIVDMKIDHDEQEYTYSGLFANDGSMLPSGYEFRLYSDDACTTLLKTLYIPKLAKGVVHRIAFNIEGITRPDRIQSIALYTSSFYEKPVSVSSYVITLYTENFDVTGAWTHKGNFLVPAVVNMQSPWAVIADPVQSQGREVDIPATDNLIVDPGFELGTGWTVGGGGTIKSSNPRSGRKALELDWDGEYAISNDMTVTPGAEYLFSAYISSPPTAARKFYIELRNAADDALVARWPDASGYLEMSNIAYDKISYSAVIPVGVTSVYVKVIKYTGGDNDWRIDDVVFVKRNRISPGAAYILQTFQDDGTVQSPTRPTVQYRACYCYKDLVGSARYNWIVSNPTDASTERMCDPWMLNKVSLPDHGGYVSGIAQVAAGTGYTNGDILSIDGANGSNGLLKIVSGVATLIAGGHSYGSLGASLTALATDSYDVAGTPSGKTVSVGVTDETEYGSYLAYIIYYRRIYDGITEEWSSWFYIGCEMYGGTGLVDSGATDRPIATIDDLPIPDTMEIHHAVPPSAAHTMWSESRLYVGCLDWSERYQRWDRPLAIQVSTYEKPHSFPTLNNQNTPSTWGTYLEVPAVTGSVIRGMIARNSSKYIFLDTEFFLLEGDNPVSGYRFVRVDSVGLASARTLVDCRTALVWYDGRYLCAYADGRSAPISKYRLPKEAIDITKAHDAVYYDDMYVLFCYISGEYVLVFVDIETGSVRIRHSTALANVISICTDNGILYGVTSAGHLLNLMGSTTTDAGAEALREVWTIYQDFSHIDYRKPADFTVKEFVLSAIVTQTCSIQLTFEVHGKDTTAIPAKTLQLEPTKTEYEVGLNAVCRAIRAKLSYTGATPPEILYMGFDVEGPTR